ncbi:MAG: transcriptional regulator [Anaerolineae bacterium]|nr:transcriptional regulator [Anaerolineae bacterium]
MTATTGKGNRTWLLALIGIVLVAALLRGWAVLRLPLDYDEPVYLRAGFDYARVLRAGDWNGVIDYAANREHPALVKLLYGLALLVLGPDTTWTIGLYATRALSALFGALAVLALALLNPLAGGLMAVHTLAIKYTGQAYLEALPHLASLCAVLALVRSQPAGQEQDRRLPDAWFWLSALALGVTAAGKFTYMPVALVVLYLAFFEKRVKWYHLLLYLAVSVATFCLLNPTLWHESAARLYNSLFFHVGYSQGADVDLAGLPWYQPLFWISRSAPSAWHPDVFFYPGVDGVIFLLALAGLYWEWRERRWVVVWVATSLLFLLVWPTKWPQYTLVLTPALCLAAASALAHAYRWLKEQEIYWAWFRQMVPNPPRSFWIISGLLVVAIAVGYTAATLQLTMGRINWSHFTSSSTLLPSNTVYDIVAAPGNEMVLATDHGVAFWSPPEATDLPDRWTLFTTENSSLAHNSVRALARDRSGRLWFGTEQGLNSYDGSEWETYRAGDLGLLGDMVYALAVGSDGRLWVGTETGAAVLDGRAWTPLTATTSGLAGDRVLALAVEAGAGGDRVWFGTNAGVSRLDTATGEWTSFPKDFDPAWSSVIELVFDSSGRLWAGTAGGGLGLWDGAAWRFYRTGNSDIPFNTVNTVAEVRPGILWVGVARPAEVGGELVEFDGQTWKVYDNWSGFSGAEPTTISQDTEGRWWVGTRSAGVDIYRGRQ